MSQEAKNLSDYLKILAHRKWTMVSMLALGLMATLALALGLPPVYRSEATILIEQQEIPQDLVRSTITSFADQRIQVIRARVMTRSNLLGIINKYNLYPEDQETAPTEVLIENMEEDISMNMLSTDVVDPRSGRPTTATIAFTLAYINKDPILAQRVTNELVSLYLDENFKSRTEMAAETSVFLTEETEKLNRRILDLENQLADFKKENIGQLPELMDLNMQLMERTERELLEAEREIRVLKERKIFLGSELIQVDPYSDLFSETGERILSSTDRLKSLRTQYVSLSARYSPDHPTLLSMQREISALEKEVGTGIDNSTDLLKQIESLKSELAQSREKYSSSHPDIVALEREIALLIEQADLYDGADSPVVTDFLTSPDNPVYIQLQAQLDSVESGLESLESKRAVLKDKLVQYERKITATPQVERQYRALTRDYENAWAKYNELRAKQMEAKLAESLEAERKAERFTLIDPPQLPERPAKPNRILILFLGLVLSMLAGVGAVLLRHSLDDAVLDRKDVMGVFNVAPLGAIPYIAIDYEIRRRNILLASSGLVVIVAVSVTVAFVHTQMVPMDILWIKLMKRLGL